MNLVSSIIALFFITGLVTAGEIVRFTLFDGEMVEGKLSLPANTRKIEKLVIFVHGTGPSTYDGRRGNTNFAFNYYDYFADEFTRRGIAFLTYNKRGVKPIDTPPFEKVDREKFRKVVPSVEVKDLATYIRQLRTDKRLKNSKIILLGWSEGTIIAAMAAEDKRNKINALFLSGYVHDNMSEVIKWQNSGGSSMANLRPIFDADKDGKISRSEYESEEKSAAAYRTSRMQNTKFDQLNLNKDDFIDVSDFVLLLSAKYKAILDAIERNDEDWIWNNYFHISINWLREHAVLEANKTRLLRLKLPIYIFHGENDASCRVEGVTELRASFDKPMKKNLREFIFPDHDHDLNFLDWLRNKKIPLGISKMFEVAEGPNK